MMWFRLAAVVVVFVCSAVAATAEGFRRECPADSYMTGFEGQAGAWIDTMTIFCARWDAKREKFDEPNKMHEMVGRSSGANWTSAHCPEPWVVAGNYRPKFVWGYDADVPVLHSIPALHLIPVLHSIEFNCRPVDDKRFEPRTFGSTSFEAAQVNEGFESIATGDCPEAFQGPFATGISGTLGQSIEGLVFICGAAPKAPAVKFTKPVGPDAFRDTMTSGRKGGGLIGSGLPPPPEPPPPPPPPAQQTATAKADVDIYNDINNQPGGAVIGMLGKDSTVPVLGHDNEKDWYRLQIGNGVGWVAANWLTINP